MNKSVNLPDLYPELSPEELDNAQFNLERYVQVVMEIHKDLVAKNGGKTPIWLKRRVWARKRLEELESKKDDLKKLYDLVEK